MPESKIEWIYKCGTGWEYCKDGFCERYTECMRKDLFDAADDMFFAPCERITAKKKIQHHQEICFFAAEDGLIDVSNLQAN
jgi:hypothetical protein